MGAVKTILIADDELEIRELLCEFIGSLGHRGITAEDGIDALQRLRENRIDIVISDLCMPRMDGIELLQQVVKDFPEVDLVAMTGHEVNYKCAQIIRSGASDYIFKPINLDELAAKLNRIIRERELRSALNKLVKRDGLTGLYNRRYFDQNLRYEAVRAIRQHYGLYLLLLDIDNFKQYNDSYGHQKGDRILQKLSGLIVGGIRKDVDSGHRYGGDEFAVVLPHANRAQALMVAQRIRKKYNDNKLTPTSLSIGVAKWRGSSESLEADLECLIKRADQALYRAKNQGGNQICFDGEQLASLARAHP